MISINLIKLLTNIILILIIPTLCQTLPGISLVSKVLGGILLIILLLLLIKRITMSNSLYFLVLVTILITSMIQSKNLSLNLKDIIYFSTFILFCIITFDKVYFDEVSNQLKNSKKCIKIILYLSNLIILVSSLFSSGYYMNWGNNAKYFKGFTVMPQVMAGASLYLIILTMFYLKDRKYTGWDSYLFIIPVVSIFSTGSRTFLVPAIILIIIICYDRFGIRKLIFGSIILIPIIFLIFKQTSIYEKFIYVINFEHSDSMISKLTSGRSDIWQACYYYYTNKYTILEKLVGTSFDNVYDINYQYTNMNIWAHNDVVNTIISSGAIGVTLYILSFSHIVKFMKNIKIKKSMRVLFICMYTFIMMTNGLFMYILPVFSMLIFVQIFKGGN